MKGTDRAAGAKMIWGMGRPLLIEMGRNPDSSSIYLLVDLGNYSGGFDYKEKHYWWQANAHDTCHLRSSSIQSRAFEQKSVVYSIPLAAAMNLQHCGEGDRLGEEQNISANLAASSGYE